MFTFPSFQFSLSATKSTLTGIDIAHRALQLVELGIATKQPPLLLHYASVALPLDAINDGQIDKIDLVIEALRELLEQSGSTAAEVAMSIPASLTTILLPAEQYSMKLAHKEWIHVAEHALANQLGYPLQQACIDVHRVASPDADGRVRLLVAAVPKESIDDRLAIAEAVGLNLRAIEPDCYAQYAACLRDPAHGLDQRNGSGEQQTGILGIDGKLLQLCLFNGPCAAPRMVYQATPLSQSQRTPETVAGLVPDLWQRCVALAKSTMPPPPLTTDPTHPTQPTNPTKVILAGAHLATPACQRSLQSVLPRSVSIQLGMPFFGMKVASDQDDAILREYGAPYLTACGLALGLSRQRTAR